MSSIAVPTTCPLSWQQLQPVCINHNLWQRRCHAYQSCPCHCPSKSPRRPSSAIWHNNGGKWSMTRIQESKRGTRQLQLSATFPYWCACQSPFWVLFEREKECSACATVPFHSKRMHCHTFQLDASARRPTLCFLSKYFAWSSMLFSVFMLQELLASDNLLANCCG